MVTCSFVEGAESPIPMSPAFVIRSASAIEEEPSGTVEITNLPGTSSDPGVPSIDAAICTGRVATSPPSSAANCINPTVSPD